MIICGMLPTLRKFFRHVAPRIIGESTHDARPNSKMPSLGGYGFGGGGGHAGGGGDGIGNGGSGGLGPALPAELGGGGYDKFGHGHDEYPLDVVDGHCHDVREVAQKGHVEVRIVGGGAANRREAEGRRRSHESSGSGESQVPIVGEQGIMTTTRISVSYSVQEPGAAL